MGEGEGGEGEGRGRCVQSSVEITQTRLIDLKLQGANKQVKLPCRLEKKILINIFIC